MHEVEPVDGPVVLTGKPLQRVKKISLFKTPSAGRISVVVQHPHVQQLRRPGCLYTKHSRSSAKTHDRRTSQDFNSLERFLAGVHPSPAFDNLRSSSCTYFFRVFWITLDMSHEIRERRFLWFQKPKIPSCVELSNNSITEDLPVRRDAKSCFVINKVISGSSCRNNDRQTGRHCLQHGEAKAFPTIRMNQAVTRVVEPGHISVREITVQINDAWRIPVAYLDSDLSDRDMARLNNACHCLVHPYRG